MWLSSHKPTPLVRRRPWLPQVPNSRLRRPSSHRPRTARPQLTVAPANSLPPHRPKPAPPTQAVRTPSSHHQQQQEEEGLQLNLVWNSVTSHHIHRLVGFLVCLRRRLVVQMFGCYCIYMYFFRKKKCPCPLCCMTQPFCTCNVVILPQKTQHFF